MDTSNLCFGCFKEHNNIGPCPHCGYDLSTAKHPFVALPIGTILNGRYLTGRVLGVGGFGVTYLAFDMTLEIAVAVKEFLPSGIALRDSDRYTMTVSSPDEQAKFDTGATKFLDEARLLAKLRDVPNIVTVQDYFRENSTAYFVMEYIEGVDLMKYTQNKGGKLSYNEVLYLLLPVIDSLAHVHAHNLLHRDISPDNIVVMRNGSTRLLDFGAARLAIDTEKSKSIILKHGFAPEEQYRKHGNQGPWSDEYALAATMYLILTGVMPPDAIERVHEDTLVSPIDLGVEMPKYANDALMKALSVHASGRFPDMASFSMALTGNQAVAPSVSYMASPVTAASADAFPTGAVNVKDGEMVQGKTVGMDQDQIQQPYSPQKMISPSILAGEGGKKEAPESTEVSKPETKKKKSIWKRPVTYILMGVVALAIAAFPIGNYITENYEWGPTETTSRKTTKKTTKEPKQTTVAPSETVPDPEITENGEDKIYTDSSRLLSFIANSKFSFTNDNGLFTLVRDDQRCSLYIDAVTRVNDYRVETLNDFIAQSDNVIKSYLENIGLEDVKVDPEYFYAHIMGSGSYMLEFDATGKLHDATVDVTFMAQERKADKGVFIILGVMPIDEYGMYSSEDWEDIKAVFQSVREDTEQPSSYDYSLSESWPGFLYNTREISSIDTVTIGNNLDCLDVIMPGLEEKDCKIHIVHLPDQSSISNACTAAEQVLGATYKFGGYTSVTPIIRPNIEMRIRNYTLTDIYDEESIIECTVCVMNLNGAYYAVIATCDDEAELERVTLNFTMIVKTLTDEIRN